MRPAARVPCTAPGTYHAHLFVYTVRGDRVATLPLTITVRAHTGTEPGPGNRKKGVPAVETKVGEGLYLN